MFWVLFGRIKKSAPFRLVQLQEINFIFWIQYGPIFVCTTHRSPDHLFTIGKNNSSYFFFVTTFFPLHSKTSIVAATFFLIFPLIVSLSLITRWDNVLFIFHRFVSVVVCFLFCHLFFSALYLRWIYRTVPPSIRRPWANQRTGDLENRVSRVIFTLYVFVLSRNCFFIHFYCYFYRRS